MVDLKHLKILCQRLSLMRYIYRHILVWVNPSLFPIWFFFFFFSLFNANALMQFSFILNNDNNFFFRALLNLGFGETMFCIVWERESFTLKRPSEIFADKFWKVFQPLSWHGHLVFFQSKCTKPT